MPFKSERPHADCDGVHGFRIRRGKKGHTIKKEKRKKETALYQRKSKCQCSHWLGDRFYVQVKGCEGSNSPLAAEGAICWQAAEKGALSRAFVFLFDQASLVHRSTAPTHPSPRTKPPLSAVSHPHPNPSRLGSTHPGTNGGPGLMHAAPSIRGEGGCWGGPWSRH